MRAVPAKLPPVLRMAVSLSFTSVGMTTSARTALWPSSSPVRSMHGQTRRASAHAMEEVRMASQAEVLAVGCGLR